MIVTKSASFESKQYFDDHKETTKLELHKISSIEDLSDEQRKVLTNLLLDKIKEKQGTEDFKKHAEMRKNDYKKIRELVIQRVGDPKKVTKADIKHAIDFFYGKSEQKEAKESPRKALEKERKTAAIVELDRLGMKTNKRVEAINSIQFLDDKILIGNTPWAYENMTGGLGFFKEKTNRHYYDFEERKAEAKKQGIVLPEKKDFEKTFKALKLEKDDTGKQILAIILGEGNNGYCDSDDYLNLNGGYGCLGSVSEFDKDYARYFIFGRDKGLLDGSSKDYRFVCRPLVKNS